MDSRRRVTFGVDVVLVVVALLINVEVRLGVFFFGIRVVFVEVELDGMVVPLLWNVVVPLDLEGLIAAVLVALWSVELLNQLSSSSIYTGVTLKGVGTIDVVVVVVVDVDVSLGSRFGMVGTMVGT